MKTVCGNCASYVEGGRVGMGKPRMCSTIHLTPYPLPPTLYQPTIGIHTYIMTCILTVGVVILAMLYAPILAMVYRIPTAYHIHW